MPRRILSAHDRVAVWHEAIQKPRFNLRIKQDPGYDPSGYANRILAYDLDSNDPKFSRQPLNIGHLDWLPNEEIHRIYVHPDYQRQGVGSLMLDHAKTIEPNIHHSDILSPQGAAWSHAVT